MSIVIITGATGFIGMHLIKEWLHVSDVEIYAVVRPNSDNIGNIPISDKIHIIECEMDMYCSLDRVINRGDYFYHLAWEGTRVPERDNIILQKKNYDCSIAAMKIAKKLGCSFFMGAGSQAECGNIEGIVTEEYDCKPNTAYGIEKLNTYNLLKELAEQYGIRFIWARIFSIYGPNDYAGTLIMSSLDKMMNNERVEMTQCVQLWDYLYVEDAVRAMRLLAIKKCKSGIYNIASGVYRPLKEYVLTMKDVLHSKSFLDFGAIPYGDFGPINLTPSSDKIKESLGWMPEIEFSRGILKLSKYYVYRELKRRNISEKSKCINSDI